VERAAHFGCSCVGRVCSPLTPLYNFCGKFKRLWVRIPPFGVLVFILWVYQFWVTEVATIFLETFSFGVSVPFLTWFHLCFVFLLWAFIASYRALPFPITEDMVARLPEGSVRFCKKCSGWKLPRTHHCSVCEKCIQRMDHHCIWVGNCVGSHNHKYFVLFLFYIVMTCGSAFVGYLVILQFGWVSPMASASGLITLVIAATIFLFGSFHCYLLFRNATTLECMGSCDKGEPISGGQNLGWKDNFKEVMGDNFLIWFLPIGTQRGKSTDSLELAQVV